MRMCPEQATWLDSPTPIAGLDDIRDGIIVLIVSSVP